MNHGSWRSSGEGPDDSYALRGLHLLYFVMLYLFDIPGKSALFLRETEEE